MGSSSGSEVGLPGQLLGAGTGQPNWGCASWAVSVHPSLGSLQPPCKCVQDHVTASILSSGRVKQGVVTAVTHNCHESVRWQS